MTERYYENKHAEDLYISLKGLVNNNDGLFKSEKQKKYFEKIGVDYETSSLDFLGINLLADEFVVVVSGEYNFDPERKGIFHKGIRPFSYQFLCDSDGVVELYKLTGKIERTGNQGGKVVWTNSELIWERPDDLEIDPFEPDPEPGENSEWVGKEGDKLEKVVDLVFKTTYETQWGLGALYKFVDEDENVYVWFTSSHPDFSTEAGLKIKFKVKGHDEYKGTKQTVINYVKEVE